MKTHFGMQVLWCENSAISYFETKARRDNTAHDLIDQWKKYNTYSDNGIYTYNDNEGYCAIDIRSIDAVLSFDPYSDEGTQTRQPTGFIQAIGSKLQDADNGD